MEDAVRVEYVNFSYGNGPVIRDAHFHVETGSFVSFVGPNGGGKTTLARLILGLLSPDSGEITVFGRPPEETRRRIGYVPQHSDYDPSFPILVEDVVLMGRLDRSPGFWRRADRQAARAALAETGMEEFRRRPYSDLSGGQRQRVLVARALVGEPDVMILDEPTSNIDAAGEHALLERLRSSRGRLTTILISHDLAYVSANVDKVVCVNRDVHIHPTSEVTDAFLAEHFGYDMRLVNHNRSLEESHG